MNRPMPPRSGIGSALCAWVGFILLLIAHFGVRPLVGGRASVDFIVIAILFASVRMRPGLAATTGFLTGLAVDAVAPGFFGVSALVLTLLAFSASWLKALFFTDHVVLTGFFVFIGKWLFDAASTLLSGSVSGSTWILPLLLWSLISAAVTAVVALILLSAFRPLYRSHVA